MVDLIIIYCLVHSVHSRHILGLYIHVFTMYALLNNMHVIYTLYYWLTYNIAIGLDSCCFVYQNNSIGYYELYPPSSEGYL